VIGEPLATIKGVLAELEVNGEDTLGKYGATQRLLLGVTEAWIRGVDLLILSTSGLDPSGLIKVIQFIAHNLHRGSVIDVFSEGTEQFLQSIGHRSSVDKYNRIIRCQMVAS